METDCLFVYGTLLKDSNHEMAQFLEAHSECLGEGYFFGKLYMVSWYPGAVLSENTADKVYGKLFKLKNAQKVFEVLNDYEGVGKHYPEPNLYRKEQTTAFLEDGKKLKAWIYVYNLTLEGLTQIKSGDFLKHISNG